MSTTFKATTYEPIKIDFMDDDKRFNFDIPYQNRAVWKPIKIAGDDAIMCSECRQTFPYFVGMPVRDVCPFCNSRMSLEEPTITYSTETEEWYY